VSVDVEKPAAGGRMIARYEGQIVLVAGAIPGERVTVTIDRVEKRLAFASTVSVDEPSADRREAHDPLCGGCVYAHIAYPRQIALKAEIIADAFVRIGKIPLADTVTVQPSPEIGYRLRARLHVRGNDAGFYREGTHALCNPRLTNQLSGRAMDSVTSALDALGESRQSVTSLELSENIVGDERAIHFDVVPDARALEPAFVRAIEAATLTGCTARGQVGPLLRVSDSIVSDPLVTLTHGRAASGRLGRQPASFFQGNRFLLPDLVGTVLDAAPAAGVLVDLYAGVGLFSVALASTGRRDVIAVEGDKAASSDLQRNAEAYRDVLRVVGGRVEDFISRNRERADAIIVDPPRTGISREAVDAIAGRRAARIIYVSCDPPTMARDARRFLDVGYRLTSLRGFDLFPNTPHVETVGVFDV
jgi:tRNA/tmRNA/rRNA uracil-C5-methylase (TrmA/RlmC/RlmD family)